MDFPKESKEEENHRLARWMSTEKCTDSLPLFPQRSAPFWAALPLFLGGFLRFLRSAIFRRIPEPGSKTLGENSPGFPDISEPEPGVPIV